METEKNFINEEKETLNGGLIEKLFTDYFVILKDYAFFYVRSTSAAEDMVQDVFYQLWSKKEDITIRSSLKSYLYRCVHNRCIEYLRQNNQGFLSIQKYLLDEAGIISRMMYGTGLDNLNEEDINEIVDKTIRRLPEKTRKIFLISRKQHLYNKEIARMFSITEKAVEYHISKALRSLRLTLEVYLVA